MLRKLIRSHKYIPQSARVHNKSSKLQSISLELPEFDLDEELKPERPFFKTDKIPSELQGINLGLPEFDLDEELKPERPFFKTDKIPSKVEFIAKNKKEVEAFTNAMKQAANWR